MNATVTVY